MEHENALIVRTLGDFTITWQGKQISSGSRDSQFARLMEILLHFSETGVERGRLEEMLFEGSSSLDYHNMLRSVIYNAKKKLEKAGLPGSGYIEFTGGIYQWTREIPVIEDARQFEAQVNRAKQTEDRKERIRLYETAVYDYRGEFLPDQTGHIWVMQEERRYQELFGHCIDELTGYYKEANDYRSMEKLGRFAAKVLPLADWETVTMDALLGMKHFDEARDFYEKTVELYLEELGVKPAFAEMNVLEEIASQVENDYAMIDEIQPYLSGGEEDPEAPGGFLCSLPVFQGIYRIMERMLGRAGLSAYLMVCTIVNSKGQPMKDGVVLDRLNERLTNAICRSVRHSDAVCKYSKNQYLVLLINTTREDCSIVEDRIARNFRTEGQRTGLKFHISGVEGKYL
ncbi:MAG: bacterial transcriptional activator domain-containing protein [Firmicutes bacterium]|nr:bacterial transcriptional activator domain-containing protein [Bacillota bacterium]